MKTIHTSINNHTSYPIMNPYRWEDIIFFDIETTGFSANTSYLYLIGCMYFKNDSWEITQWLADDMSSEAYILEAFFQMLKSYKRLVHFNGSGFDIPFIMQKCKQYNLPYTFEAIESFDIYKKILPFKKILPLPNLKLKTLEKFVGVNRKDVYNGEDLIQIYANYLGRLQYEKLLQKNATDQRTLQKSHMKDIVSQNGKDNTKNLSSDELSAILLLHNSEDVQGLTQVADILFYRDIFEKISGDNLIQKDELSSIWDQPITGSTEEINSSIRFSFSLPYRLPQPVTLITPFPVISLMNTDIEPQTDGYSFCLIINENRITMVLPVYEGELKYFYEDYRDYFYLPKEDTAIHKSVAQYVDKEFKLKAKPATCYTKKYSRFIPQTTNQFNPLFKNNNNDKMSFFEITNSALKEPEQLYEYVKTTLQYIIYNKGTRSLS